MDPNRNKYSNKCSQNDGSQYFVYGGTATSYSPGPSVSNDTANKKRLAEQNRKALDYNDKGIEAYEDGDYERAITLYQKALSLRPQSETIKANLANAKEKLKEKIKLEKEENRKKQVYEYMEKGKNYSENGEYEKAISCYSKILDTFPLAPNDKEYLNNQINRANKKLKEIELEKENRKKGLEYNDKGNEACDDGDYERAITLYQKALSLRTNSETIKANLANAKEKLRAIELEKENRKKADEYMNEGNEEYEDSDYEEAKWYYKKALALYPVSSPEAERVKEKLAKTKKKLRKIKAQLELTQAISSAPLKQEPPLPTLDKTEKAQLSLSLEIPYQALTIGEELGRGAFGIVYKGTYHYNEVAIKQLFSAQLSSTSIEEFRKETAVMAQLRSPHIVQLYGICQEIGHYCIVMEYMPKGSLYSVIHNQDETLTWPQRESIALDIAKGLAYLHQGQQNYQILHRDLKSLNVLLDTQYHAKLTDFGLAKVKQEVTSKSSMSSNKAVGTLPWMAPELFEDKPLYTVKSDIYSYGVVLWELAARQVPFKDIPNPGLIAARVCMGKREEVPQHSSPKLAKLIRFCWAQEPEKRPNISEVISVLQATDDNFAVANSVPSGPADQNNLSSDKNNNDNSEPRYLSNHYSLRSNKP